MLNQYQEILTIHTVGRDLKSITPTVSEVLRHSEMTQGLCHIFLHHTSASLIISENADPDVKRDLEAFMQRLIPDGDPIFKHIAEGPDDMPSHVRSILTQSFLVVPFAQGELSLGTWQGIFLWEHRLDRHERKITVTIQGT